jgi:hypothetical protein
MLEPYVWYDPHEIIGKLEFENWLLKIEHKEELRMVKRLINDSNNYCELLDRRELWSTEKAYLA